MSNLILNGEQTFLDNDGNPLVGGKVHFYIPYTSTRKDTFQDFGETILNTNPVILDGDGRAVIWGTGSYRQVLTDSLDNEIWDRYVTDGSFIPGGTITLSKIQSIGANTVLGAISAGSPVQLPMTAAGRNIVAAANVAAQQTLLNLVPGDSAGNVVKWTSNNRVLGFGDGSATVPSMTFSSGQSNGFYYAGTNTVNLTLNGADMFSYSATNGMTRNFGNAVGFAEAFQILPNCSMSVSTGAVNYFYSINVAGQIFRFHSQATEKGSITVNATGTQYNTVSDYRLKENIKTIDNPSELVLQLKPCEFTFKGDETHQRTIGFIAHEVQEVIPFAVSGTKDGNEYQQLDQSKFIGLLTAALQDALKRIEALENNGK